MSKELIVNATTLETKVAVLEDDQVTEIFIERSKNRGILGNIYKGRVTKVLPGMQSAFVDIGLERDAFLYVSDFVEDYEEYEKMFTDAEEAAAKLLKVEIQENHIQPDEPRRRGRGRSRRKGRDERAERAGGPYQARLREPAPQGQPQAAPPAPAAVERTPEEPAPTIEPPQQRPAFETVKPKPEKASQPSSWLDEVREAQAALERESRQVPSKSAPVTSKKELRQHDVGSEKDREAQVRGNREVDEFSLSDDPEIKLRDVLTTTSEPPDRAGTPSTDAHPESSSSQSDHTEELSRDLVPVDTETATDTITAEDLLADRGVPEKEGSIPKTGESAPKTIQAPPSLPPAEYERKRRRLRRSTTRRRQKDKNQQERHFSIGDLLREGQEIIVQVAKEPIAKKGARITSHIALPGRYIVYMPTVDHVGVSRKILSEKERVRLREIVLRLRGDSKRGFIVRTAGENCDERDLRADMQYLTKLWDEIRQKGERTVAAALLHGELDLVPRLLRDYVSRDFKAIRVDDEAEYERVLEFVHKLDPSLVNRVKLYTKTQPIFDEYGINGEIEKSLKQKVWLKSGGYIVINQTEALVAIDVNTGKFVGRGDSLEETITRTNLDAVKEVVRQIRLRDLGGIIVIDFIDMDERRNRQKVMEALERELAHDKSPTKILQFNEFGLVAITRKRVKQSLERTLCQPCPYCNGSGMVKSVRTVCYSIHAEVKKLLPTLGDGDEIMIRVNPEVGQALRDKERTVLEEIQEMSGKEISVKTDPLLHFEQFDIVEM
ncbi:MAG: Rne/Rng family ribonuclease [Acidobacteria bacterium]|nr:Rne/Rng family ribonuclease [Acidobacteriota bacterium]